MTKFFLISSLYYKGDLYILLFKDKFINLEKVYPVSD